MRIVVPLSPGGFADTPARMLAPRLSEQLGRPVLRREPPGRRRHDRLGLRGEVRARRPYAAPSPAAPISISAHLYKSLAYDVFKDFTHIAMMASGPYVLVVNPQKVAAGSVRELIALAKSKPGQIDYASSGNGSSQHLVGALFNSMTGAQLNHVPYKGSGPAMQDLLGAQVGVSFAGVPNVLSHVKSGRLKALGVTTAKRWSELPDVPTLAEAGVPGYEATVWLSISGPAGMPADIVQRLNTEDRQGAARSGAAVELPCRRRRADLDEPAGAADLHARRVREVGPGGARNRRDR